MIREITHIFRYKFLAFIKISADWSLESVLKNVGSFVVYTGFAIGAFFMTHNVIAFLLEQAHIGTFLLHRFLSMALYVFFLSINVGNIIVSYSTLYRSGEVTYLLTKPVSYTSLFIIKFLDNFFYSSTTLFMIGLSVLAGYASYFNLPWTFYVWVTCLVFIPFMVLAAVLGVMMLMGLMQLAQKVGPRVVIGGLVALYIGSVYVFFKLSNPMKLVSDVMQFYPNVNQYFGFLDPPFAKLLPSHWVAEAFYWTVTGGVSEASAYVGLLLAVCAAICIVSILIARRWYYPSWVAFLGLRISREDTARSSGFFHLAKKSAFEAQAEVLLKKEFWQFFREPSQWIHFLVILFLLVIFVGSISQIDIVPGFPFLQTTAFLVVFLFNAFFIASIALRFVYPLVSIEGEAFWKTRSAPIGLKKVAALKFIVALLFAIAVGQVLNGFSRPLTTHSLLVTTTGVNAFFVALAMVALSFGMGSLFATYKERNPIRVASSQGASLTFLVTLIYLVFLIAVLFFPINRYFELMSFGLQPNKSQLNLATAVVGFVSLILAMISYGIGVRSLKRDF